MPTQIVVLTNFEINVLSILTFQIFVLFYSTVKFFVCYFCLTVKNIFAIIFQLTDTHIYLKIYCNSNDFDLYSELSQCVL